jgi:hypothetical protein
LSAEEGVGNRENEVNRFQILFTSFSPHFRFALAEERNKELEVENEKERELHSILRGKFDDMMRKFDT